MGTGNFYNHENGIFVLKTATFDDALESLKSSYDEEEITNEMVENEREFMNDDYYELFLSEHLVPFLENKGYMVIEEDRKKEISVFNKGGKIVAEIYLKGGYYEGVQAIVETDPEELLVDNDDYSPHHKRLLKYVGTMTKELVITAQFSNGETIYSYK
jgi:hypothetical protein